jgi:hypothetical protein
MRATAWNNGSHHASGAGYGLRVSGEDRDRYFDRDWSEVVFDLDGEVEARATISDSFWRTCSELRSVGIGKWLRVRGLAPWPKGIPPTLEVRPAGGNRFNVLPPSPSNP